MSSERRRVVAAVAFVGLFVGVMSVLGTRSVNASPPYGFWDSICHPLHWQRAGWRANECNCYQQVEGNWYWMRSPEQERRVVMNLYNRYCVRCHGVDGRGVWDIPDVPDFSNAAWQASRTDEQLARLTLEGRGAVMPAFRGTFTLEEAWAMSRYLRTFTPQSTPSPMVEPPPPAPPSPTSQRVLPKSKSAAKPDARLVRQAR